MSDFGTATNDVQCLINKHYLELKHDPTSAMGKLVREVRELDNFNSKVMLAVTINALARRRNEDELRG